jgi:Peptidase inhibitor I78 family
MLKPVVAALAVGLAVACAGVAKEGAQSLPAGGAETCDTEAYQYLVGQKEAQIEKTRLPGVFRIVCHNCAVTMDFNPQRLTVSLGPDGKVASARCG